MSKPTHSVKLRSGGAPAEQVNADQLANMKKVFGTRFSEYDVTPIEDAAPKPLLAETPAKSKAEKQAAE